MDADQGGEGRSARCGHSDAVEAFANDETLSISKSRLGLFSKMRKEERKRVVFRFYAQSSISNTLTL